MQTSAYNQIRHVRKRVGIDDHDFVPVSSNEPGQLRLKWQSASCENEQPEQLDPTELNRVTLQVASSSASSRHVLEQSSGAAKLSREFQVISVGRITGW